MMKNNDLLIAIIGILVSFTILWGITWSADIANFVGNFFFGSGYVTWMILGYKWLRKVLP